MREKQKIIQTICNQLEQDLIVLKAAALATYDAAINEESKPENEYDTRGLEASYLAGAQAKRVADTEELIYTYRNTPLKEFTISEAISSTALVEVEFQGRRSFIFIVPKGGGQILNVDSKLIQTVTPSSPLGESLLGLKVGEIAHLEAGAQVREYKILSLT